MAQMSFWMRAMARYGGYGVMYLGEVAVEDVEQQLLFAVIVMLYQRLGDTTGARHLTTRGGVIAVCRIIPCRVLQDGGAFCIVVFGDRASHGLTGGPFVDHTYGFALRAGNCVVVSSPYLSAHTDI